jgi:hypothetical protein
VELFVYETEHFVPLIQLSLNDLIAIQPQVSPHLPAAPGSPGGPAPPIMPARMLRRYSFTASICLAKSPSRRPVEPLVGNPAAVEAERDPGR